MIVTFDRVEASTKTDGWPPFRDGTGFNRDVLCAYTGQREWVGGKRRMPPLELGSDLGIERAAELKEMLAAQVDSGRSVVLDLSKAERIHSASLQLITAFVRERQNAGRKTRIADPSPAFEESARVLALNSALGLSESGDE